MNKIPFWTQMGQVDQYKVALADQLALVFGTGNVRTEWEAMLPSEKARFHPRPGSRSRMYSPWVDIAVGPFALEGRYGLEYDEMLYRYRGLLDGLLAAHGENATIFGSDFPGPYAQDLLHGNYNARCFLAIEIEKGNGQAKYLMGSALNAAALGRVGVVVCWTDDRLHALLRIREYVAYLTTLEKNIFTSRNLLVVSRAQVHAALRATQLPAW